MVIALSTTGSVEFSVKSDKALPLFGFQFAVEADFFPMDIKGTWISIPVQKIFKCFHHTWLTIVKATLWHNGVSDFLFLMWEARNKIFCNVKTAYEVYQTDSTDKSKVNGIDFYEIPVQFIYLFAYFIYWFIYLSIHLL